MSEAARRRRTRRWLGVLLGIVSTAVVVAWLAAQWIVGELALEKRRAVVQRELSKAFGLEVRIRGGLGLALLPTPRFELRDVAVLNAPDRRNPYLLRLGAVDLEIHLLALLFGRVEIDEIKAARGELHLEPEGETELPGDLPALSDEPAEDEDGFVLRLRSLWLRDVDVSYDPPGQGKVWAIRIDSANLAAEDFHQDLVVHARGAVEGSRFDLNGSVGPVVELFRPTRPYPVSLRGALFEARGNVVGTIETPLELAGLDVGVDLRIADLGELPGDLGERLPPLGPIAVAGRVREEGGVFGVRGLHVVTERADPLRAEVRGRVDDLAGFRGVELDLDLGLADLALLGPLVDRPLPSLAPVDLRAKLDDADGSLGIEGTLRGGREDGPLFVEVEGGYGDLSAVDGIDVRVRARSEDLAVVGELLEIEGELPDLGPLAARGRLRDRDGVAGLEDLEVELGRADRLRATGRGTVRDLVALEGVAFAARFEVADLRELSALVGGEPPDVGAFRGELEISDRDGSLGLDRFEARGGREGLFQIEVSGALDDVRDWDEIEVDARVEGRDLAVVGEVFGEHLPPIAPVAFEGRVRGSKEEIQSSGRARLGETRLQGTWSGAMVEGERPRLRAAFRSAHVRLRDIGIEPHEAPSAARIEEVGEEVGRWWAGEQPLPFDLLQRADLSIDVVAQRITGRRGLDLQRAHASLDLANDRLEVRDLSAFYEGGRIEAHLGADVRPVSPRVWVNADVRGMSLETLTSQLVEDSDAHGVLDLSMDLESEGRTRDELRANLTGEFGARIRQWAVVSTTARRLVSRLADAFIRESHDTPREFACLVAVFEAEDGRADVRELVLHDDEVTIWGSGYVDLETQRLRIQLEPEVRNPSSLSIAAEVAVRGTLDDPQFRPSPLSIATSAGRGLFRAVLKPARVLLDLFPSSADGRENPCDQKLPESGLPPRSGG